MTVTVECPMPGCPGTWEVEVAYNAADASVGAAWAYDLDNATCHHAERDLTAPELEQLYIDRVVQARGEVLRAEDEDYAYGITHFDWPPAEAQP